MFNGDWSICIDFLFSVSFLLSQGGGTNLSKLGDKFLSSIRSPRLLGWDLVFYRLYIIFCQHMEVIFVYLFFFTDYRYIWHCNSGMHALFAAFANTRYSVIVHVIGIQVYVLITSYFPSKKTEVLYLVNWLQFFQVQ